METGEAVARGAATLVGTRFRLHGRGGDGLDCVGLVAAALTAAGRRVEAPTGYALRGGTAEAAAARLAAAGLVPVEGEAAAGDVLLMEVGPAQFHLLIRTGCGFVHADAGLRRVVETNGLPRGRVVGAWRVRRGEG